MSPSPEDPKPPAPSVKGDKRAPHASPASSSRSPSSPKSDVSSNRSESTPPTDHQSPGNVKRIVLTGLYPTQSHPRSTAKPIPPMPSLPQEKCFTWCSQRADSPPFCRMLCFRKRQPKPDESLNPPRRSSIASSSVAASIWPGGEDWKPFEGLRKWVEPYSLVYIRGTPDGVVGRYMEEMQGDDGFNDFGTVSRGADEARRRKKEGEVYQSFDWGPDGSLKYLPLTSLLHPLFILPQVAQRMSLGPQAFAAYARTHLLSASPDGNLVLQLWEQIHTGNIRKTAETMWEKRLKVKLEYVNKDGDGNGNGGPRRGESAGSKGGVRPEGNGEVKKAIQREMDGGAGKKGSGGGEGGDA